LKKRSWSWIRISPSYKNVRNKGQNERLGYGSRLLFFIQLFHQMKEVKKMKLLKWMKQPKKTEKPNNQTDLEKTEFGLQVLQQTQEFFLIY